MTHPPIEDWQTIEPRPPGPAVAEPRALLTEALSADGVLRSFVEAARRENQPVLLVVNDGHRATQTHVALEAIAEVLGSRLVLPGFRALVAAGTHQFPEHERREFEASTFGGCGLRIDAVSWNDSDSDRDRVKVGSVRLHKWLAEARFVLAIGSVEPHYFAGVTGAHKTLTVGCMARGDIERNHEGAMSSASENLRLNGNPVYHGVVEILGAVQDGGRRVLAINEVVDSRNLLAAAVGDPVETVELLLPTVRSVFAHQLPEPVDLLRLRVPLPLGRNLYQADKALKNNHLAVRYGGGILLEADCPEGIGPDAFLGLLRRAAGYADALRIVADEGYRLGDHKAVKLLYLTDPKCRGVHVVLVSDTVTPSAAREAGMRVFADASVGLDWLTEVVAASGPCRRGAIIEDAGVVCTSAPGQ